VGGVAGRVGVVGKITWEFGGDDEDRDNAGMGASSLDELKDRRWR